MATNPWAGGDEATEALRKTRKEVRIEIVEIIRKSGLEVPEVIECLIKLMTTLVATTVMEGHEEILKKLIIETVAEDLDHQMKRAPEVRRAAGLSRR